MHMTPWSKSDVKSARNPDRTSGCTFHTGDKRVSDYQALLQDDNISERMIWRFPGPIGATLLKDPSAGILFVSEVQGV